MNIHKSFINSHLLEIDWTLPRPPEQTGYRHHKGLFMFHKNVLNSVDSRRSAPILAVPASTPTPTSPSRLVLVPSGSGGTPKKDQSPLFYLIAISAHRCASFFAEAAVLVLVLALLDRFMLKGRMEFGWIFSAVTISLSLLGTSIVTDYFARRWPKAHS